MKAASRSRAVLGKALPILLLALLSLVPGTHRELLAQAPVAERLRVVDSTRVQVLTTRDGSRFVGRIMSIGDSTVIFRIGDNRLTLRIADIATIEERPAQSAREGGPWFSHPHQTNLVLGPTGRTLARGQGFFTLHELFFPTLNYGATDRLTIGGGLTLIPGLGLDEQIMYMLPKVGVIRSPELNVALGAVVMRAGDIFDDDDGGIDPFGVLYGAGTLGGPDANFTAGLGFGFYGDDIASRPLVQLGGQIRVTERAALVTENWVIDSSDDTLWLSWTGVRFLATKVSVDAAVAFAPGEGGWLPWIGVTVGF